METGELTLKEKEIVDCYFLYWKSHIKALEDKHRVVQFEHILNVVALNLYGPRIAFELAVRFLLDDQSPSVSMTDQ